jgi:outer membrane protein TolC
MKVLTPLTLLWLLSSSHLLAQESNSLESYISELKVKQYSLDYEKNEADASLLRDSWISPLNLNYTYSKSNPYESIQTNQSAAIRVDQPIFKSGGIYFGIKYAEAMKDYRNYSVDVAKRKMIKNAVSLLMQIKQVEMKIARQKLQIENTNINLELKKEQYLNGQLDSGFLDSAIIERNIATQLLYDIETAKERLISSFRAISTLSYKEAKIPHLELISEEEFMQNNLLLDMASAKEDMDRENKNVTISKYLPQLNFVGGYNWTKNENRAMPIGESERDYYDYGVRASLPLSINTLRDVESSRVDFLKSKLVKRDREIEAHLLFEQVMQNINNSERKNTLAQENAKLRLKLLEDTKKLYSAGYKTQHDIDMLQNSLSISKLDSKIYDLDKQLELLNLYEVYEKSGK